jgi:hypothetical protein
MGADGWLGIGWPKEYGGQGRSMRSSSSSSSTSRCGPNAPVPILTINTVGPTLMHYGTDEQKDFFLPKILAGEMHFAIGYTEPGAGTDLASLKTRAVRDGDEYVINGQKIWTSLIHRRRLRVAGGAHRPRRRQEAQGHLDHHRPDRHARVQGHPPVHTMAGGSTPAPPSTRTCGCRPPTWWARRTRAGGSSPTSSTTSG